LCDAPMVVCGNFMVGLRFLLVIQSGGNV